MNLVLGLGLKRAEKVEDKENKNKCSKPKKNELSSGEEKCGVMTKINLPSNYLKVAFNADSMILLDEEGLMSSLNTDTNEVTDYPQGDVLLGINGNASKNDLRKPVIIRPTDNNVYKTVEAEGLGTLLSQGGGNNEHDYSICPSLQDNFDQSLLFNEENENGPSFYDGIEDFNSCISHNSNEILLGLNVTSNTNDEIVSDLCFNDLADAVEVEINSSNPESTISIKPNNSSSQALEDIVDDPDYEPNGESLVDSDEELDDPTLNDGSQNIDNTSRTCESTNTQ